MTFSLKWCQEVAVVDFDTLETKVEKDAKNLVSSSRTVE